MQPAALPQRLLLTLISGYGNSSPTRHVDLLINGKKFDEITVDGYTRTLSKPFEAEQPWSQLEFVVHETAQPLPRKFALWKKWVPADARGLNLAISELKVVTANETEFTLPGELDLTSKNGLSSALTNGIYPDRWGGHEMRISLQSPKGASAVEISGEVPHVNGFSFPYEIEVFLKGAAIGIAKVDKPGNFSVRLALPEQLPDSSHGHPWELTLNPASVFVGESLGINSDQRPLSIKLDSVRFVQETTSAAANHLRDIQ